MKISDYMNSLGLQAREAAFEISNASSHDKNQVLVAIAEQIQQQKNELMVANQKDLEQGRLKGLEASMLDRLELTESRIQNMIDGLHQVAALPDPVGEISNLHYRPTGIQVGKMRVPLGVIGIIYESRPNVTIEAASLCLKSGNAVILRGGSEAIHSNQALASCISHALKSVSLSEFTVQIINTTDREAVGKMITMPEYVDVIVPRGGKSLIERISQDATVPVIKHLDGVCHTYIDQAADKIKAINIAINAKTQRYGTCNTMETLLVEASRAKDILPELINAFEQHEVELRCCDQIHEIFPNTKLATEEDWHAEYLGPILAVKLVANADEAITHINKYSSSHTDVIVTEHHATAMKFLRAVDSSSVMINASSRFADGFEYGLGAEIGISTDKLHARGPVGLEGLTSQKYVVFGDGQVRV